MSTVKKDQEFQKFLDTQQYARKGILLYERIFGTTYISTGGEQTTRDFFTGLTLPGLKVIIAGLWCLCTRNPGFEWVEGNLNKEFFLLSTIFCYKYLSLDYFSMWSTYTKSLKNEDNLPSTHFRWKIKYTKFKFL